MGRRPEAKALLLKSMKIFQKSFGNNHLVIAMVLFNLGIIHLYDKDYATAERNLSLSFEMHKNLVGMRHQKVALCLGALADVFRLQGKYKKAAQYFQLCITGFEQTLGPNTPRMIYYLQKYAATLEKLNRRPAAQKLRARAEFIKRKSMGR